VVETGRGDSARLQHQNLALRTPSDSRRELLVVGDLVTLLLPVLAALAAALALVTFVALSVMFFTWAERKVSGRIQDRLGPTRVGKLGLLQSLADTIKVLTKEDTIPGPADHFLFRLAPYLTFAGPFVALLALPFGPRLVTREVEVGAFFVLAVLSTEVFGVLLAGYGSGSKWSLFGGIREAAQVVSYEVPRGLCVLIPVALAGILDLNRLGALQAGGFWHWQLFSDPFTFAAFFVFFICATAGCKRAPFDLAEAESELVAGFLTEYSGLRWSYFFMAEYTSMFAVSGLAALLFLGGWHTGFLPFEPTDQFGLVLGSVIDATVFVLKCVFLVFVMMWVRWSLPRLRIDQVMTTCLKYLLPISCALLLGACVWRLALPEGVREVGRLVLAVGSVLLLAGGLLKVLLQPPAAPAGRLPGVWSEVGSPTRPTVGGS
jgi:NADH-quinone oxidoreductase subunit H